MPFKDLFNKESRRERSLQKNIAKAASNKIKPDDRKPALWSLLEDGSEQAVAGLLGRFTFNYDNNMVVDEEEKNMVYRWLVELGERILPPLRQHLRTAPSLSIGLRLLQEIVDHEKTWEVIAEVLQSYSPEYERDPSRKLQLMTFLGEFHDPRAVDALIPFLGDHDETVRFVTVESLLKQADQRAQEPLLIAMDNPSEESFRIKNRIVAGLAELGWDVAGHRATAEKILADSPDFFVDAKNRIRRKAREQ